MIAAAVAYCRRVRLGRRGKEMALEGVCIRGGILLDRLAFHLEGRQPDRAIGFTDTVKGLI